MSNPRLASALTACAVGLLVGNIVSEAGHWSLSAPRLGALSAFDMETISGGACDNIRCQQKECDCGGLGSTCTITDNACNQANSINDFARCTGTGAGFNCKGTSGNQCGSASSGTVDQAGACACTVAEGCGAVRYTCEETGCGA
jgi:hypothetical protein